MSAVDKRLIDILAVVSSARYEDIAKLSGICKLCGELRHVAVVCFERGRYGEIFEYRSRIQPTMETLGEARAQAAKLRNPPAKFGGWICMSTVPAFYKSPPPSLKTLLNRSLEDSPAAQGRTAIVEGLVYVQDGYGPVSIPLLGEIDPNGEAIVINGHGAEQPLLHQAVRTLNRYIGAVGYAPSPENPHFTLDVYDPTAETFVPRSLRPVFPLRLALPLQSVPVIKRSVVTLTSFAHAYATGQRAFAAPMCSMKFDFIDASWTWPVGLRAQRQVMQASWRVRNLGAPLGTCAVRPLLHEPGAIVVPAVPEDLRVLGRGHKERDLDSDMDSDAAGVDTDGDDEAEADLDF
ncbi:uncharacterized protein C8Q71DRAFT_721017 [Rhodofomes roseus]|uniref:Uncharacterized protein n=1 Tax=Rhodofomes roseus TaxID=34475 RepID=A0ABQ8KT32_9APHY|nr:uncharacterized protein C8Q71DRAFT_721017 [Rhodofomes roseus]KAH9841975.1 hypothetical protein C8Q71DRAFT_721017 [Rhodofomes roseus]